MLRYVSISVSGSDPASPNVPRPWEDLPGALAGGAAPDRVEIKAVIAPGRSKQVIAALGADPRTAERRQVYFLDTPDLKLYRRGIVVRIRKLGSHDADVVVKLRRGKPFELAARHRRFPNLTMEVDALPTSVLWSAAITRGVRRGVVRGIVAGRRSVTSLLSREQRSLLGAVAGGIELDRVAVLGRVAVLKARTELLGCGDRPAVEIWRYADGSRLLEVSAKCSPRRACRVAAATVRALTDRGVALAHVQQSKTGATLAQLTAGAA